MNFLKKTKKELNSGTPVWFKLWHSEYFKPSDARSKRNERWLYIIITAIIGTSILVNKYSPEIASLWRVLFPS